MWCKTMASFLLTVSMLATADDNVPVVAESGVAASSVQAATPSEQLKVVAGMMMMVGVLGCVKGFLGGLQKDWIQYVAVTEGRILDEKSVGNDLSKNEVFTKELIPKILDICTCGMEPLKNALDKATDAESVKAVAESLNDPYRLKGEIGRRGATCAQELGLADAMKKFMPKKTEIDAPKQ